MTKQRKGVLSLICVACFSLSLGVGVCMLDNVKRDALAEDSLLQSFETAENITVSPEKTLSSNLHNGKKGYLFATEQSGSTLEFGKSMSGEFSIDFTPIASKVGETDFASLTFGFSSPNSRLSFDVNFLPSDNGVSMQLLMSNYANKYQETLVEGSFTNTSSESIGFSFDPETMRLYNAEGTLVFDLRSAEFLHEYKMTTVIPSFDEYLATMTFSGVKSGKKASVLIYDICGLRLDSSDLFNTATTFICNSPVLDNGVCGVSYSVRKDIRTYNVLEGFKEEFVGDISIYNEKNAEVLLTKDSFVPMESGVYYVHYTPVNTDGVSGDKTVCRFYVYQTQPDITFESAYPLEDAEVGVGTRMEFPAVKGNSELSYDTLTVKATVSLNGKTLETVEDCSNGMTYTFAQEGDYSVDFSCVDVSGYIKTETVHVIVGDSPVFMGVQFDDVYEKDYTISLENIYALYNGEKYTDVSVKTVYPDGRETTTKNLTLGQEGEYKITCIHEHSDRTFSLTKYFTVRQSAKALWVEQSGLTVQSDAVAPSYADKAYKGTMLSVSRALEAEYKNVIDLSDNTANDLLCELFVSPKIAGSIEFGRLDLIFTDIYDEENVVDICLTRPAWYLSREEDKKNMSVIALPQRDYDINTLLELDPPVNNYQHYYYYARSINSTFYGQISNNNEKYPSQSVRLYLDYEKGVLYAESAYCDGQTGKVAVADLTNEAYVGVGNAWRKFTTGEVRVSVRFSEFLQESNLLMINLDGQELSGAYTEDKTAPSIFLDYCGNEEDNLPLGVVDTPYPIFSAYSNDVVDGKQEKVSVSVYKRRGENWIAYENVGMQFVPNEAGVYMLRYQTTDIAGNIGTKEVIITVVENGGFQPLQYYFNKEMKTSVFVGERYVLRQGKAIGGSGVIATEVSVYCNGNLVALDENNSFVVESDGEYTVSVRLRDYLGVSDTVWTLIIDATYADEPLIIEQTLPHAVVEGEEIVFPQFLAKRYSENGVETLPAEIWVSIGDEEYTRLSSLQYTPNQSGVLSIKVKAGQREFERQIYVTKGIKAGEKSPLFTSQYLYSNGTPKADSSMLYTFEENGKISVARKIDVRFATFELCVKDGENFSAIYFTLTDSVDPEIAVTGKLIKNDESSSYLLLNGIRYYINNSSFLNQNLSFSIEFDQKTNCFILGNNPATEILYADNGNVFHGFTSGAVYIDFAFEEVNGAYTVGVKNVAGQNFKRAVVSDKIGPTFKFLDEFNNVNANETVVVPRAVAFDFNGVASMCVTVETPSGKVLYDNVDISKETLSFKAEEVGSYRFTYLAIDSLGNKSTPRNRGVDVADKVPPTLIINGTVPTTASLNKKIVLPFATYSDDYTSVENIVFYVYALSPDGKMTILNYCIEVNGKKMEIEEYKRSEHTGGKLVKKEKYEFTPNQKGLYVIIYFAQDDQGATATQRFEMRVK